MNVRSSRFGVALKLMAGLWLSIGTADLKIQGDLNLRQCVPQVAIDISVERSQAAENVDGVAAGRDQLVHLSTEIVAPVGHYVVLGVTPVKEKTLAFAMQVNSVD